MAIIVPNIPKVVEENFISKELGEKLLAWKDLFKKNYPACNPELEEEAGGAVNFAEDGSLMQVLFDSPGKSYGQAYFYVDNKASVLIEPCGDAVDFSEYPITTEPFEGTWEEVYHKIMDYLRCIQKCISDLPEVE